MNADDEMWTHGGGAPVPEEEHMETLIGLQRQLNAARLLRREEAREGMKLALARAEQARIQYQATPRWRWLRRHRLAITFMDKTVLAGVLAWACGERSYLS